MHTAKWALGAHRITARLVQGAVADSLVNESQQLLPQPWHFLSSACSARERTRAAAAEPVASTSAMETANSQPTGGGVVRCGLLVAHADCYIPTPV